MASMDSLKQKWMDLPPKVRTWTALGALMAVLMGVGGLVVGSGGAAVPQQKTPPSVTNLMLPKPKDTTPVELAAGNEANNQEIKKLRDELEKSKADQKTLLDAFEKEKSAKAADGVTADMVKEMMAMKSRMDELEKSKAGTGGAGSAPKLSDPLATPTPSDQPTDTQPKKKLRITGNQSVIVDKKPAAAEQKTIAYLPPGSMFEAILLNGMDAPTSSVAQKNPVPALMRVKSDAILPNNYQHDIKECFVLVSGFGVLSSERAQLRTETFSCVREGGVVIEGKLDGYVVGEDGRVAPRGRLVSKQGQMVAKSLAAGVLSGFGQALTPSTVPQLNLMPGATTQTQTTDIATLAQSGVARGFADASKAASSFFLEMAREMTPVVEIDAGRKLTIVLIKGIELK